MQNKVGQILFAPLLRHVLGQVATKVNFRFMMDRRRVFVANLSKGRLGETHSALLASLLVTGFEVAALSRADIPAETREIFSCMPMNSTTAPRIRSRASCPKPGNTGCR